MWSKPKMYIYCEIKHDDFAEAYLLYNLLNRSVCAQITAGVLH